MLNLNYNLIGAAGKQNRDINGFAAYPRYDEFSASLALAIPGAVFYENYQPLFGATTALDDISGYIKEGTTALNLTPLGVTGSGLLTGSSTLIAPQFETAGYSNSIQAIGNVAVQYQNSGLYQRLNLTTGSVEPTFGTSKGWVWEAWIAVPVTASIASQNGPTRLAVMQPTRPGQGPGIGDYWWWPAWGGDTTQLSEGGLVSGSSYFVKNGIGNAEEIYYPYSQSLSITPYQFKHYAVSYSNPWYIGPITELQSTGVIRQYIDGQLIASGGVAHQFPDTTGSVQLFGYVGTDGEGNVWNNRFDTWFQDLRFYSGSNKNYTGSVIPVPEPMIVGRPY